MNCGQCRFRSEFPDPGPEPEIAPPPRRHWLLGGESDLDYYRRTLPLEKWKARKAESDKLVECIRFPQHVRKLKDDLCGEFSAGAPI